SCGAMSPTASWICWMALSAARKSRSPSGVKAIDRWPRRSSWQPSVSSSVRICRLTADCGRHCLPSSTTAGAGAQQVRMTRMVVRAVMREPVSMTAEDGYKINGFVWRHAKARDEGGELRPVVVINAATSVRCRYYFRFADFLQRHGFDVVVYDY